MPINALLREQQNLRPPTAVEVFSDWHSGASSCHSGKVYADLIPTGLPGVGEQFGFEVNLDACTGCKACVAACHSLNGLDEGEAWRDIGQLVGEATSGAPWQQTVTTACHHCVEPACLEGCPMLAYEKDPVTGIVRHLDDQCIGCQYCALKCPYGVPKYNARLGIVRKCDMCHQRLKVGESPACVQACPNGAIAIRIVKKADALVRTEPVIEGAVGSDYTKPVTLFVSAKPRPAQAAAPDACVAKVEHGHWPLVVMLVLTQLSAGAAVAHVFAPSKALATTAAVVGIVGIHASVLHLGQPLKAWKAVLGWRTSWLSREVMAFGAFAGALSALAACAWLPMLAPLAHQAALGSAGAGILGVFCSVMVYADTRREGWAFRWTMTRFGGTAVVLGMALVAALAGGGPALRLAAAGLVLLKLAAEWRMLAHFLRGAAAGSNHLTALATRGPLKQWFGARAVVGLAGALSMLCAPWLGLVLLVVAEGLERTLFFMAQHAPRMPGVKG